jgi:O-antigen ligase
MIAIAAMLQVSPEALSALLMSTVINVTAVSTIERIGFIVKPDRRDAITTCAVLATICIACILATGQRPGLWPNLVQVSFLLLLFVSNFTVAALRRMHWINEWVVRSTLTGVHAFVLASAVPYIGVTP